MSFSFKKIKVLILPFLFLFCMIIKLKKVNNNVMKKLCLFALLILLPLSSCKKENKINTNVEQYYVTEKQFLIEGKGDVNYPSVEEEIDQTILKYINDTYQKIEKNYTKDIDITYECYLEKPFVNYLFYYHFLNNQILKSYNFDLKTRKQVEFNTERFIQKLNQKLHGEYVLTTNDIGFIQIAIRDSTLHVYLSPKITNREVKQVVLELEEELLEKPSEEQTKKEKKIALTFDDGPSSKTKELVDLLEELEIVSTFFVLGCNVEVHKEELRYIDVHGHEIGNHSYSHPDFKKISIQKGLYEIEKTQQIVYDTILRYPRIFRFPYGSINRQVLLQMNMPAISWNADSLDWQCLDSKLIIQKIEREVKENGILLFHDFKYFNKKAITKVVQDLKKEGYTFVTVSELLGFCSEEELTIGKVCF